MDSELRPADAADWRLFWERPPYPEEQPAVISGLRERYFAQEGRKEGAQDLGALEYCVLRGFIGFDLDGRPFEAEEASGGSRFLALRLAGGHFAVCARQSSGESDLFVSEKKGRPTWFFSSRWLPAEGCGEKPCARDMAALRCLFRKDGWERLACACERGKLGEGIGGLGSGPKASQSL